MQEIKVGDPQPLSGLDMGQTIAWYEENKDVLSQSIPDAMMGIPIFSVVDGLYSALSEDEMDAVISLFPTSAISRSRLFKDGAIIGKPPLYFAKDALPENITTTEDSTEALSPTAIIPSYTDNTLWRTSGIPSCDIHLYQIPDFVDPQVRRIIHAEGLAHEFAHTFVTQLIYSKGYQLKLPGGEVVDGFDFFMKYAHSAEAHPPISHYASFYRKEGEEFSSNTAIEEDLVETITAHLLGFVFCDDKERRLDPLNDRPEVKSIIEDFLNAELV